MADAKYDIKKVKAEVRSYFTKTSGGKTVVHSRRASVLSIACLFVGSLSLAVFGPSPDRTYYMRTSNPNDRNVPIQPSGVILERDVSGLLTTGKDQQSKEVARALLQKRQRVSTKYFASQIVDGRKPEQKVMLAGSKLVAFLLNSIDTRSPRPVRARILRGGESNGIEIERGAVLTGQYSYGGSGNRVFIVFSSVTTPDGELRRIQAHALDSASYTAGIDGETHSDGTAKTVAGLGLSMLSGMADVLTEKESVGSTYGSIQAKPTMRNALLQGVARSSQEQISRTMNAVDSSNDYVIVPEGQEMIVELIESYK